jgi:hypothetical protein
MHVGPSVGRSFRIVLPRHERPTTPKPSPRFPVAASAWSAHGEAGPTHCPEPVTWRGSWRAPNGRRYRIEACEGHRPAPEEGGPAA